MTRKNKDNLIVILILVFIAVTFAIVIYKCYLDSYIYDSRKQICVENRKVLSLINNKESSSKFSGGFILPFGSISGESKQNYSYIFYAKNDKGEVNFYKLPIESTTIKFSDNPRYEKYREVISNRRGKLVYYNSEESNIIYIPETNFTRYISIDVRNYEK